MASVALGDVLQQLGRLFGGQSAAGLGEAELLQRFAERGDGAAFEAIVARHGPLVLAVCRRLLGRDTHAVDDAFQATFLVLVRRARSIRDPGRLGPWLYGVAHRVARRARAEAARRKARERGGDAMNAHEPAGKPADDGPGAELHDELNRLPRAYRDVVVLCDLEGRTHEEAARLLGWPVGTVKGRLSRARVQLRRRLERRGIALTVPALAALLGREVSAAVPMPLLDQTVRAAIAVAAGKVAAGAGSASASAVTLAEGVHRSMTLAKFGGVAALLCTATVTTGSALVAAGAGRGQPEASVASIAPQEPGGAEEYRKAPAEPASPQPPPDPGEDAIKEARSALERARLEIKRRDYEAAADRIVAAMPYWDLHPIREVRAASVSMMKSEEAFSGPVPAAESHLQRMTELDQRITEALAAARGGADAGGGAGADMTSMMKSRMGGAVGRGTSGGYGGMMGRMMASGGGSAPYQNLLPPNMTTLPEVGLLVAEAKLWVAETKAGRAPTGADTADPLVPDAEPLTPTLPVEVKDAKTRAILMALERPLPLKFPTETPLEEFLAYIRESTKGPELPNGIPIYVDPAGVMEAEKTMQSPIQIDLADVPLKTSLRLALEQIDLGYAVKDGLVLVHYITHFYEESQRGIPIEGEPPIPGYGAVPIGGFPPPKPRPEPKPPTDGEPKPGGFQ